MSYMNQKINNHITIKNLKTIQNNSQVYSNKKESLPVLSYRKIQKLNNLNIRRNLNPFKIPKINNSSKNILINLPSNESIKHDFITKVIVENPPSQNDIIFIIEK